MNIERRQNYFQIVTYDSFRIIQKRYTIFRFLSLKQVDFWLPMQYDVLQGYAQSSYAAEDTSE